jgi:hypothetical protein
MACGESDPPEDDRRDDRDDTLVGSGTSTGLDTTTITTEEPIVGIEKPRRYAVNVSLVQSAEMGEVAMRNEMKGIGEMSLVKVAQAKGLATWRSSSSMTLTGTSQGNTIAPITQKESVEYAVDTSGALRAIRPRETSGSAKEIIGVIRDLTSRHGSAQIFLHPDWRKKKVGESWTETTTDTVRLDSIPFGPPGLAGDLDLILRVTTRYTSRGMVDTLGGRALRIDNEIVSMTMEGTIVASGIETEMTMQGKGTGRYYYDVADRLQLVGGARLTMLLTISIPAMKMVMPMSQEMTTSFRRTEPSPSE